MTLLVRRRILLVMVYPDQRANITYLAQAMFALIPIVRIALMKPPLFWIHLLELR